MKTLLTMTFVLSISLVGCERNPASAESQLSEKTTLIERKIATPSGDWIGSIDYTYGQDGNLRHASYEFRTANGYDKDDDEFSSTSCVREYDVSEAGKLILRSKVMTDISTGKIVNREFYEPEVVHWMTLVEAQEKIQAKQVVVQTP